jgi:hypothetical protein
MSIEAMKQALEALEDIFGKNKVDVGAINSLRQAIAEAEKQEPVAVWELQKCGWETICDPDWLMTLPIGTLLYTHPPKREWVGLTDEQIIRVAGKEVATKIVAGHSITPEDWLSFARAIEAAHGIKENT